MDAADAANVDQYRLMNQIHYRLTMHHAMQSMQPMMMNDDANASIVMNSTE
jgi:hypothetical protein